MELRTDWLKRWTNHRKVWEMTEAEYNAMPEDERFSLPCFGPSPSNTNYYIIVLSETVNNGIRLSRCVWNSLSKEHQTYLRWVAKGVEPVSE